MANGTTLSSNSSYFQTRYDPKDWRGTIKSFGFTSDGAVNTAAVLWTTDTTIVPGATAPTYQSWNTVTKAAVTLAYGNFSSAQQTSLSQDLPTGIIRVSMRFPSSDQGRCTKSERIATPLPLATMLRTASTCLLYTSPSPRDRQKSRMPSSA